MRFNRIKYLNMALLVNPAIRRILCIPQTKYTLTLGTLYKRFNSLSFSPYTSKQHALYAENKFKVFTKLFTILFVDRNSRCLIAKLYSIHFRWTVGRWLIDWNIVAFVSLIFFETSRSNTNIRCIWYNSTMPSLQLRERCTSYYK